MLHFNLLLVLLMNCRVNLFNQCLRLFPRENISAEMSVRTGLLVDGVLQVEIPEKFTHIYCYKLYIYYLIPKNQETTVK